ncbi:hypothetical protein NDU88_005612 [Pleurodeles waltl]|uniref:Uncharacterized protein n=1 Tax=Pleurodeles waltl TaxID=8319 RepID=A0AAV7PJ18_PLEWA|nr:hypothetical protein NDU88_005612 [Pleurodeles waltl]
MAAQTAPSCPTSLPAPLPPMEATDRILQEIAAVKSRWEVMNAKISDLTEASTSIWADITGFQETMTDLDQRLSIVEDWVAVLPDLEAELRSLHAKVTDLEDRSHKDNILPLLRIFYPNKSILLSSDAYSPGLRYT